MNVSKPIPVDENGWLDYQNQVYIIERNECGNVVKFQFGGISCKQTCEKGFVVATFETTTKWFNPNFWYLLTRTKNGVISPKNNQKIITYEQIIEVVKKELEQKIGWRAIEIYSFEEAFVFFKYRDDTYILTWENCD